MKAQHEESAAAFDEEFDYLIVGSGAGGGTLAARLVEAGYSVGLLEAGGNDEGPNYQVPAFHPFASEDEELRWDFFVDHYEQKERAKLDPKYSAAHQGIYYPRSATLGGCTAHNAMIFVAPSDADWDFLAEYLGDESWNARHMRRYFHRVERCLYHPKWKRWAYALLWLLGLRKTRDPSRHGYHGWLTVEWPSISIGLADKSVKRLLFRTLRDEVREDPLNALRAIVQTGLDPNDARRLRYDPGAALRTPISTLHGKRRGARERVKEAQAKHPDLLHLKLHTLATRVLLNDEQRAIGIEALEGKRLYRADRHYREQYGPGRRVRYRARREVILSGGAFNTPQLLMLSGIGPVTHLSAHGIPVRVPLEGVGTNLQDRYEVGVVYESSAPWSLLQEAKFLPGDKDYQSWELGKGPYTSNGALIAFKRRSKAMRERREPDPDLFVFGMPVQFGGYRLDYSEDLRISNRFTWAVLKAYTQNRAGMVRLRNTDARCPPQIAFRYFDEGSDQANEDLEALVEGVQFVRRMSRELQTGTEAIFKAELEPGPSVVTDSQVRDWVRSRAWGHHASCSCPMGEVEQHGVVDSRLRVHGVRGLRIVDASVFPRIPGTFIACSIYMVAEKAADMIQADAAANDERSHPGRAS